MKNKQNKQAQIGTTLTWFTAFIIIFFIIVIFLSAAIFSSGRKYVSSGWDEITLKEYSGNLEMQRNLFNILNGKIEFNGKEARVKDILRGIDMYNLGSDKKNELTQKLKKQTEDILKDSLADCYAFEAVYGIDNPDEIIKNADPRGAGYVASFIEKSSLSFSSSDVSNTDLRGVKYAGAAKDKLLQSSASIILVRDTNKNVFGVVGDYEKITIKFYSGKCL